MEIEIQESSPTRSILWSLCGDVLEEMTTASTYYRTMPTEYDNEGEPVPITLSNLLRHLQRTSECSDDVLVHTIVLVDRWRNASGCNVTKENAHTLTVVAFLCAMHTTTPLFHSGRVTKKFPGLFRPKRSGLGEGSSTSSTSLLGNSLIIQSYHRTISRGGRWNQNNNMTYEDDVVTELESRFARTIRREGVTVPKDVIDHVKHILSTRSSVRIPSTIEVLHLLKTFKDTQQQQNQQNAMEIRNGENDVQLLPQVVVQHVTTASVPVPSSKYSRRSFQPNINVLGTTQNLTNHRQSSYSHAISLNPLHLGNGGSNNAPRAHSLRTHLPALK
eukprot:PhF_6_TR34219/c0_g2_i6/m.50190